MLKIFTCDFSKYSIQYDIKGEYANMDYITSDYKDIISLVILLKKSVDELKNMNIKYITMLTYKNELEHLKNTSWIKYENYNNDPNILNLVCKIDEFIKNMDISLGFSQN